MWQVLQTDPRGIMPEESPIDMKFFSNLGKPCFHREME